MTHNEQPLEFAARIPGIHEIRELKLQLPVRTHVRLRAEKLLRGQCIGTTVEAALNAYFVRRPTEVTVETVASDGSGLMPNV